MPWYEYHCASNGRTIEAMHPMSVTLRTWGEVCDASGESIGATEPRAPVEKLFNAHLSIAPESSKSPDAAREGPCGHSCACHPH